MKELRYIKIGSTFYYRNKFYKKIGTSKGLTLVKSLDGYKKFKTDLKVLQYFKKIEIEIKK